MKYKLDRDLLVENVNNEVMIYDSNRSVFYSFNESAGFIIKEIESGKETEVMIERLVKKYGINKAKAQIDLDEFLKLLLDKKIITSSKTRKSYK